jgi:hypothetical protein
MTQFGTYAKELNQAADQDHPQQLTFITYKHIFIQLEVSYFFTRFQEGPFQ